jgi:hypothetical protein
MVAAGLSLAAGPQAKAQMKAFDGAGYWEASAGMNDRGGRMCELSTHGTNWLFALKFTAGKVPFFHIINANWHNLPNGQTVRVNVQIDGNGVGWTMPATAFDSDGLEYQVPPTRRDNGELWFVYMVSLMSEGQTMTVSFPDGTTQPWRLSLTGSRAAMQSFMQCGKVLMDAHDADTPAGPAGGAGGGSGSPAAPVSPKYQYEG